MKKWGIFIIILSMYVSISCGNSNEEQDDNLFLISTQYGNITIKLYDDTPEHKKNFQKLVDEDFYDGLLFHRVIPGFMIQGGDPDSRDAQPGDKLGGGSLDYTIPAEISEKHYHKHGAVAAARRGGPSNPEKRSSATQFYIVQGRIFTDGQLDTMEIVKNNQLKNELMRAQFVAAEEQLQQYRLNNDEAGFNLKIARIREQADSLFEADNLAFKFTPDQRDVYTTFGGYPSLDGDYSVFGEVVEGMDVVEKITSEETDGNDRPLENIDMKIKKID
ncbi:MAG TPA: peptidylprolyl isomerase [Mariniphaga sp.]|nr:peptidylprolyl isomerase [Mariniphaga sp.]